MTALYLDDRKVFRWFGRHPERGKPLPGLTKSTHAGMRHKQMFGRDLGWVPNEITVNIVVSLKLIRPGYYDVHVDERYRQLVEFWLLDKCGFADSKPYRKRRRYTPSNANNKWHRDLLRRGK